MAALIVGKITLQTSPDLPKYLSRPPQRGRRAWRSGMAKGGVDLGDLRGEESAALQPHQMFQVRIFGHQ